MARILEQQQGNVIDLQTQVIGTRERPVYAIGLEAEMQEEADIATLAEEMAALEEELGVEITVRASDQFTL